MSAREVQYHGGLRIKGSMPHRGIDREAVREGSRPASSRRSTNPSTPLLFLSSMEGYDQVSHGRRPMSSRVSGPMTPRERHQALTHKRPWTSSSGSKTPRQWLGGGGGVRHNSTSSRAAFLDSYSKKRAQEGGREAATATRHGGAQKVLHLDLPSSPSPVPPLIAPGRKASFEGLGSKGLGRHGCIAVGSSFFTLAAHAIQHQISFKGPFLPDRSGNFSVDIKQALSPEAAFVMFSGGPKPFPPHYREAHRPDMLRSAPRRPSVDVHLDWEEFQPLFGTHFFPSQIVTVSCLLPEAPPPQPPLNSPNPATPELSLEESLLTDLSVEMSQYWEAMESLEYREEQLVFAAIRGCRVKYDTVEERVHVSTKLTVQSGARAPPSRGHWTTGTSSAAGGEGVAGGGAGGGGGASINGSSSQLSLSLGIDGIRWNSFAPHVATPPSCAQANRRPSAASSTHAVSPSARGMPNAAAGVSRDARRTGKVAGSASVPSPRLADGGVGTAMSPTVGKGSGRKKTESPVGGWSQLSRQVRYIYRRTRPIYGLQSDAGSAFSARQGPFTCRVHSSCMT